MGLGRGPPRPRDKCLAPRLSALRDFDPSLEEEPMLMEVCRYFAAFVGRPLDEPSRAIEPVRLDHESSRVQPNDVHAEVDGPSDQVVEHSRSNVQRARLRHDIHALDLSRCVGKTAKGSDPDRAACPLREQEKPRRASVGTQRHGDLRGIRRLLLDAVFLAKSFAAPSEVCGHQPRSRRFVSFRPRLPDLYVGRVHRATVLR